jgi:hypothetical protein
VKGFDVAVAAFIGVRRNGILGLRWDADIDLERATISVTRNVEDTKNHGLRIGTPKSKKNSVREFQIDAGLVALLRQVRSKALQLVAGVPDGADVDLSLVKLPKDALAFPVAGTLTTIHRRRFHCLQPPRLQDRLSTCTLCGQVIALLSLTVGCP